MWPRWRPAAMPCVRRNLSHSDPVCIHRRRDASALRSDRAVLCWTARRPRRILAVASAAELAGASPGWARLNSDRRHPPRLAWARARPGGGARLRLPVERGARSNHAARADRRVCCDRRGLRASVASVDAILAGRAPRLDRHLPQSRPCPAAGAGKPAMARPTPDPIEQRSCKRWRNRFAPSGIADVH